MSVPSAADAVASEADDWAGKKAIWAGKLETGGISMDGAPPQRDGSADAREITDERGGKASPEGLAPGAATNTPDAQDGLDRTREEAPPIAEPRHRGRGPGGSPMARAPQNSRIPSKHTLQEGRRRGQRRRTERIRGRERRMSGVEEKESHPAVGIPSWWEEAADSVAYDSASDPPPIAVVCGPGNTGKSTFSRLLLETLLKRYKRVGYLDTNVGQPEFTAPGCLSLHIIDKPPPDLTILCMKKPERCFFYGDVNCQKDKNVYLNNILGLYDNFQKKYYQPNETDNPGRNMLPLVVNTSGWVKGPGYDLLVEMLRYISPTHVVQIRVSAESKNLPRGVFWLDGNQNDSAKVIEISAAEKDPSTRTVLNKKDARLLRDIRIIAYFRQCLPRELGIATYKELVHSLGSTLAYGIPLSKLKVIQLHCQDSSSEDSHTLSATIVGLGISYSTPAASHENSMPWCVGLGFVRAVDVSKDLLCVITPVPLCSLEKVDLILQSCLEVPACLLQAQQCASPCKPTIMLQQLNGQEVDAKMAKIERQFSDLSTE